MYDGRASAFLRPTEESKHVQVLQPLSTPPFPLNSTSMDEKITHDAPRAAVDIIDNDVVILVLVLADGIGAYAYRRWKPSNVHPRCLAA